MDNTNHADDEGEPLPMVTLADLRRLKHITQEDLARTLGTTQAQVARVEKRRLQRGRIQTIQDYVEDGLGYELHFVVRAGTRKYYLI